MIIQDKELIVPRFTPLSTRELDSLAEEAGLKGYVHAVLRNPDGEISHESLQKNLITELGDEYYGERAAGIATPPNQVTGMRLGTGGETAASKTGPGAAIGAYISGSSVAIDGGYPTSALSAGSRRIAWRTTWAAAVATNTGIDEVVLTNETPLTDVGGAVANTVSRAVLAVINKGAGDTLEILWNHDLLGA